MLPLNKIIRFILKQPGWKLGLAGAAVILLLFFLFHASSTSDNGTTFTVRRGPLQIKVLEGGSVEALEAQEIRSQIKGYQGTKILSIVEEGYLVTDEDIKKGKVLVELDSSDLRQRITTQDIQFQSTLSALIEAQQAYDIQLNQNVSDIKAAEQKARFARMDLEKHLGDKNTQEIIDQLGLYEIPFTNGFDLTEAELETGSPATNATAALNPPGAAPVNPAPPPGNPARDGRGRDPDPPRGELAGNSGRSNGPPAAAGNTGPAQLAESTHRSQAFHLESVGQTNLPSNAAIRPGGNPSLPATNAPLIDYTIYAKSDKLGDGAAKQQLRKLEDDVLLSTQELSQAQIRLSGTERLYASNFVTKTELDSDNLSVKRAEVKLAAAQTAFDLYIKYEFCKTTEEFVSKYDEALRSLERARKEAISKLAQARARLKAAEGRYRIEMDQREELATQLSNCVIRAQRPGLVVYGEGRGRGFMFNEEQIREGATVRERQPIITIPDMSKMAVRVSIHESHIKKVKKGQKATVQVDAFPDEKLNGEVTKVGVLPDSQNRWMNPDMKVYVTTISVEGMRDWLKPGMSAKVEIRVKELPDVVYVPIQAVMPFNGKQVCFVANGGTSERREVEIGEFNDEFIEVKNGLSTGEKVFLNAPQGTEQDTTATEIASDQEPIENESSKPQKTTPPAPKQAQSLKVSQETRETTPATGERGPAPARRPER
ncbi:MAG: efflux RND transporter periplasmic adaptor subunit [Candidatus Omnitrophica bacterium]|nr:efflux RND transporter periplasmic adaptor subunit [Candidatus Omnitrophota bacterium]